MIWLKKFLNSEHLEMRGVVRLPGEKSQCGVYLQGTCGTKLLSASFRSPFLWKSLKTSILAKKFFSISPFLAYICIPTICLGFFFFFFSFPFQVSDRLLKLFQLWLDLAWMILYSLLLCTLMCTSGVTIILWGGVWNVRFSAWLRLFLFSENSIAAATFPVS